MIVPSDIPAAVSDLGISEYKIGGDELKARCPNPAHDDRSPSWSINLDNGLNHCFSCGFSSDFLGLVQTMNQCSYEEACNWCLKLPVRRAKVREKKEWKPQLSVASFISPPDEALESRRITRELADQYELLWYDGLWIAPVRGPDGTLWGWQEKGYGHKHYRNVPDDIPKSGALFGFQSAELGSTLVLVESPIDVVRLASAGIYGGVSSYGVHVSAEQVNLLLRRAKRLVLALDNDRDGLGETARILREYPAVRRIARVFDYGVTNRKDPGEMTDEQIADGVHNAINPIFWRNGNSRWR